MAGEARRAVVLGAGVNGLGVIRALAAGGVDTHAIYTSDDDEHYGRYTRHAVPVRIPPGPCFEDDLNETLRSLADRSSEKPFLFATSDAYVMLVSKYRETLRNRFRFRLPDSATLDTLTDKRGASDAAARAGLRVPASLVPRSEAEAVGLADDLPYPIVVKPLDSFTVDFPGKNIVVESARELTRFVRERPDLVGRVQMQEVVPGDEENIVQCTAYLDADGAPLRTFTMRKMHQYPVGYGVTTFGRAEPIPEASEATLRLCRHLGLTGFVSVEFKMHPVERRYYFIEANPRLPWYNALFLSCGVNFPMLAVQDLSGEDPTTTPALPSGGVRWMYFRNELAGWSTRRAQGGEPLRGVLVNLARTRSFAYWDPKDPMPFLMASRGFAGWALSRIGRRLGLGSGGRA